ncbi:MAG: hypothetical protein DCC55_23475 [Chloroflexi bacterium]|nr:MAG: hypothetical protein DCC55_23475 [Chloroflexota bacterium]
MNLCFKDRLFLAEYLNRALFADGHEAQTIVAAWRQEDHHHRLHNSEAFGPGFALGSLAISDAGASSFGTE